jgi:1-acyl-sn-glycerol-3-phosphate acyltransferase
MFITMVGGQRALPSAVAEQPRTASGSPLAYRIAYLVVPTLLRLLFRFEVTGRANLPAGRSYIVVANHLNWLDAFAILIALPVEPQVHLVGWDKILDSPKLSRLIRLTRAGFIPIQRDARMRSQHRSQTQHALERCLRAGYPLVLFPEGQMGCVEGHVMKFRSGFARLSRLTGAPIVPMALAGTRNLWLGKRIRIAIGAPIDPPINPDHAAVEDIRAVLVSLLPHDEHRSRVRLFERKLTRLIPSLTNWVPADF